MTVTVARDTIVCRSCGSRRVVDPRTARRSRQVGGIPCGTCRGVGKTRVVKDEHLRFWLRRFGADPPKGVPVREFITAGGAPPELTELARQCNPDVL